MKATSLKTAAIMAASVGLFAGSATAQNSATSGVVGYETLDYVAGFNYLGLRLHSNPAVSGALTGADANGVSDSAVDFSTILTGETFILEIEDGAGAGIIQEVTTTGDDVNEIATQIDLAAEGVAAGDKYTLRAAATLESVFGAANEAGLAPGQGGSAGSTQVWLPDGAGGFDQYYYFVDPFFGTEEWRTVVGDTAVTPADVNIVYTDAIVLNAAGAGSIVVTGDLKTSPTSIALTSSFNYVGSVYPVGATIESTFGAANEAGLTPGQGGSAGSDQIWIHQGGPDFDRYFYFVDPFFGTEEWRDVATNAAIPTGENSPSLDAASGYILLNGGEFNNVDTTAPGFYEDL